MLHLLISFVLIPLMISIVTVALLHIAELTYLRFPNSVISHSLKKIIQAKPKIIREYVGTAFFIFLVTLIISITFYYHFQ